jgi:hypothetical protein
MDDINKDLWIKNEQTNSKENSHFWEATSALTTQETPRILLKPKVRYPVHKSSDSCPYAESHKIGPTPPAFL